MLKLKRPTFRIGMPQRDAECERQMNVAFYSMLVAATEAGWDEREAAQAFAKAALRCAQRPPADEFDWYTGRHIGPAHARHH
jgi:hypothetical protein